jgi:hypothetical protein
MTLKTILEMTPCALSLLILALLFLHVRARYKADADLSNITGEPVTMRDAELYADREPLLDLRDFD